MAVHTTQAEIVIRLTDEDRILLRQLIDRLANPVQPTLPWPAGVPGPQSVPQWWQNPVICGTTDATNKIDC